MVTESEIPDKHSDLPAGMFTPTNLPAITKGVAINNNNNTGRDQLQTPALSMFLLSWSRSSMYFLQITIGYQMCG
jgi:hypothetical protein